jgi:hypothetical protein
MRSPFATLASLTIPAGAAPGDPALILGATPPAELVAYYSTDPTSLTTIVACNLYRLSAGNYSYEVLLRNTGSTLMLRAIGSVNGGTDVVEEMAFSVAALNSSNGRVQFARRSGFDGASPSLIQPFTVDGSSGASMPGGSKASRAPRPAAPPSEPRPYYSPPAPSRGSMAGCMRS